MGGSGRELVYHFSQFSSQKWACGLQKTAGTERAGLHRTQTGWGVTGLGQQLSLVLLFSGYQYFTFR